MPERVLTRRYAEAFLQYTKKNIGFDSGVQAILDLKQVLFENPQFKTFLENPEFGEKEKFGVIDHVVTGNLPDQVSHFLKLLISKNRIRNLGDMIEYVRMNYGHGDMVSAVLTSALPLDDDLVKGIKEKLEKRIQRRINLYVTFNSDLLGGFKVVIGNQVFDGSVKRQLAELRETAIDWRME